VSASEYGFTREAEKFRGRDTICGPEIANNLRPVIYPIYKAKSLYSKFPA